MPQLAKEPLPESLPVALKRQGKSLRWVAGQAGVSPGHLSRVIRGADGKRVTPGLARRVARALDLPDDYFPEVRLAVIERAIRKDPGLRDRIYRRL